MAQALRQKVSSLLLRRSGVAQSQQACKRTFSAPSSAHEDAEETVKWRNITIAGYVLCTALTAYNFIGVEHEHHEERPAYTYLHIRNKEFPWGPDGLFEYHE